MEGTLIFKWLQQAATGLNSLGLASGIIHRADLQMSSLFPLYNQGNRCKKTLTNLPRAKQQVAELGFFIVF